MKIIFIILIIIQIVIVNFTFAENESLKSEIDKAIDNTIKLQDDKAMVELAMKMAKWDKEIHGKAFMLVKDVLYGNSKNLEYISITLIKEKSKKRPAFISFKTAKDIDKKIKLTFVKRNKKKIKITDEFEMPLFEEKNDFVVRLGEGHIKKLKKDLLKLFLNNNFLFITVYKNKQSITKCVPLFDFQKKYKEN